MDDVDDGNDGNDLDDVSDVDNIDGVDDVDDVDDLNDVNDANDVDGGNAVFLMARWRKIFDENAFQMFCHLFGGLYWYLTIFYL